MELEKMEGLSHREAKKRLLENGENKLETKKDNSPLKIFLGQFRDLMVLILLVATGVSAFLGEIYEAISIVVIVLINALLGFFQEWRCEKTLETLSALSAPTAKVMREGKMLEIPATQVVVGDILLLAPGDCIAADSVILKQEGLSCDEALLTGESGAVQKKNYTGGEYKKSQAGNAMVFMGTSVTAGRATVKVTATGMATEMGTIATLLKETKEQPTPLQLQLDQIGKVIGIGCLGICAFIGAIGVLRGEALLDMLITAISLAVAAVPEGLPAIVTISLAIGVRKILKKNALVKKLHAVETLGCTSVICSDKTGTLTQNKMLVTKVATGEGIFTFKELLAKPISPQVKEIFQGATFCNNAKVTVKKKNSFFSSKVEEKGDFFGEPTEIGLLQGAVEIGGDPFEFSRQGEIPFDSSTKEMVVWGVLKSGEKKVFAKGAPEVILASCNRILTRSGVQPLSAFWREEIIKRNSQLASEALRVIAFAYGSKMEEKAEKNLIFAGLIGLFDPPRPEAAAAVAACKSAKIKTVMITGDHPETAKAVANQLGITKGGQQKEVYSGKEIDMMNDESLKAALENGTVFARVTPLHKLRIVRAFKELGQVVAMTGDGVNDAPAVKEANVGVSMGHGGTDVTREAAQVVLLDNNFATLVLAVEEGRVIYKNIRRFLRYLLSCNVGEVLTMLGAMVIGMPIVLSPLQLLLVNLVTDSFPAISLGLEPAKNDIMKEPPRKSSSWIFSDGLLGKIAFRGFLIAVSTLGAFGYIFRATNSLESARTAALITLSLTQLFHAFECRDEKKSIFGQNFFSNPMLLAAVLLSAAIVVWSVYTPWAQEIFRTVPLPFSQLKIALIMSLVVPLVSAFFMMFKKQ